MKPIKFKPTKQSWDDFCRKYPAERVLDTLEEQLKELFLIRNPKYRFGGGYEEELKQFTTGQKGEWFYFPWSKTCVHYLPDEMHQELRTARNKNLITKEEQTKFYNFKIGVAGLSVGSHAALTLAMMGAGRVMKLADPDEISGSNLNRIRTDFTNVEKSKCDLAVEQIYQINPYAEVYSYPEGVLPPRIDEFLAGPPKLDVLVEELDDLGMKVRLRLAARRLGIPVVMATDNGDNVIVDIERYDLDKNQPVFNGALGDITAEDLQKFKPTDLPRLASMVAGPKVVMPRMLASVLEVGKTLYSWPQLGDAATLSGVVVANVVKRLALKEPLKTGKIDINIDALLDPEYGSDEVLGVREEERKRLLKIIGLDIN